MVACNPTLGASVVNKSLQTTTHIEIKSQPERHTFNRAELAAITIALETNKLNPAISILTDSAFSINTIRRYAISPLSFTHHPHKHLLQLADYTIHARDNMGLTTHIGKVKSHARVTHNDEAGTTTRNVVEGIKKLDIIFTDADPPVGGLRSWPQIRKTLKDTPPTSTKLANLHTSLRKLIQTHTSNTIIAPGTIYNHILRESRATGSDHTIHAYSTAPFRARRDSLEVAWGVHVHRCKRKHSPTLICTKCNSPLTNTHILGGCRFTAKLRIKRHNSTFQLLLQLLQRSNGGRWPILCADLGHKPVTDFTNLTIDSDIPPHRNHQGILHPLHEGLQDDKSENLDPPQSIPDYILHPQHKPKQHKPDLIRAVGYTFNTQGKLVKDLTYRGQRQIQIIKSKYSTNGNIKIVIDHI
jgi:ribonuclease HI